MKSIAFFNNKGGVSKTTTAFNLGWKLASQGKRVLLVDADPQCNLTGMILGYKGPSELELFYKEHPDNNVKAGLSPAFESRPISVKALECLDVSDCDGLFLMPGHIGLSEYEVTLGMAHELGSAIPTLMNLPGAFSYLINCTAAKLKIDYAFIDMSPSLGAINQNLLMTSDYFILCRASLSTGQRGVRQPRLLTNGVMAATLIALVCRCSLELSSKDSDSGSVSRPRSSRSGLTRSTHRSCQSSCPYFVRVT
jgi:cellulose biosynthesis protein BcsQ